MKILLGVLFSLCLLYSSAQDHSAQQVRYTDAKNKSNTRKSIDTVKFDQRMLRHYSPSELTDLKNNHPVKYKRVFEYLTNSYSFIYGPDTTGITGSFLDPTTFDVSKYELHRKENESVTLYFDKQDVTLILFPKNRTHSMKGEEK